MKTSAQHFPIWSLNSLLEQTSPKQVQCQTFILRIKLYSKQYISKEGSDLDVQLRKKSQVVRTVIEQLEPMSTSSSPSSCSSPGFALPDVSIPSQVLERVCHSLPPLLPTDCTIEGRNSFRETKMKQYGAPTATESWQFSRVQGSKGSRTQILSSMRQSGRVPQSIHTRAVPALTTLDIQSAFVSLA